MVTRDFRFVLSGDRLNFERRFRCEIAESRNVRQTDALVKRPLSPLKRTRHFDVNSFASRRTFCAVRIIAGEFRGRRLLPPESDATRPITDRVKQSLFDILAPVVEDAVVYDCFAGTGSMGLECLSRGARHATFFEADPSAAK